MPLYRYPFFLKLQIGNQSSDKIQTKLETEMGFLTENGPKTTVSRNQQQAWQDRESRILSRIIPNHLSGLAIQELERKQGNFDIEEDGDL